MPIRNHPSLVYLSFLAILIAVPAGAVTGGLGQPATCVANAATNRDVRAEGVTELLGDVVLTCTGGIPTPINQPVPLMNVHINLPISTPLTSRIMGTALPAGSQTLVLTSEATLLIDEPFPVNPFPGDATPLGGAPTQQISCLAAGGAVGGVGQCEIKSVDGTGTATYLNQYNTFQGLSTWDPMYGMATIDFLGVPFDPPGPNSVRIVRVTNLRGDITHLPVAPANIAATVTFPSNPGITLNQDEFIVATAFQGLVNTPCSWSPGTLTCLAQEGFASAFKTAVVTSDDVTGGNLNAIRSMVGGALETQNVTGAIAYFTESGLIVPASSFTGSGIGQATHGTWLMVSLWNIPSGVKITAPGVVNGNSNSPNLQLYRIDVAPGWTFNPGFYASPPADKIIVDTTVANPPTKAYAVYEVVADNPNLQESANIPLTVATQQGVDAAGIQGTVTFAPIPNEPLDFPGTIGAAWELPQSSWLDIPRFIGPVPTATSALQIDGIYFPGQSLTAHFTITNKSPASYTFQQIQPMCTSCSGGYPPFKAVSNITLGPGQSYVYLDSEIATTPGTFSYRVEYQRTDNSWVTSVPGSVSPVTVTIPVAYTLTVSVSPPAGGTARATTSGISGAYAAGSYVCLTETPKSGYLFWMWSGATLDGLNCLIMNANTTVTANFVPTSGPNGVNNRSFVSAVGSDANNCSVTAPCCTLTRALAMTNGGGEIIVLTSGEYGPAIIAQPVTISANGVSASITAAASGNGLTINTPGNVTITGLTVYGGGGPGPGAFGIEVDQVGYLRLYNSASSGFSGHGMWLRGSGSVSVVHSKFNDNGESGLVVTSPTGKAYVRNSQFEGNGAGVLVAGGVAVVAGSTQRGNATGIELTGTPGSLAVRADQSVQNEYGMVEGPDDVLDFLSITDVQNWWSYQVVTGGTLSGSAQGTSLVTGSTDGSLSGPTALK